jgi:hypothetical protein
LLWVLLITYQPVASGATALGSVFDHNLLPPLQLLIGHTDGNLIKPAENKSRARFVLLNASAEANSPETQAVFEGNLLTIPVREQNRQ